MAIDMNALLRSSEEGKKKTDQFLRERYGVATREPEVNLSALIPRPQSAVKPAAAGVNAVNTALLPQRVMEAANAASQLAGQPKPVNWQTRPYWQPWEENEYNGLTAEQAKLDSAAERNARLSAQMESLRMDNTLTPEQYKAKLAELEKENWADSAGISQIRQNIAQLETARELKKKQDELSRLAGVSGRTDFEEVSKKGRNSASNPIQAYKTIDFNERADYSLPDYLTDKERAVIDYYTGAGDFSKANEYLLAVSGELSRRAGEDQAKKTLAIENDFLRDFETARLSVNSGLSSGFTGISEMMNRLAGNKTPLDQTAISYAYETVRPELTGAQALISDIGYSVGNMAPSIAVGMINPLAGSVTMGVSSAGNSYAEARRNGYSDDQALAYGILNGVSESAMQYLLGGVGKLGKGGVSTAVSKIPGFSSALTKINNVTSKLALNPKAVNALKTAGKIAADANDEGIEEYLQATIDPIFRNVILGENNEIKAFSEEQLYSYLLGALTSIGMNAATGEYRTVTLPDGRQTQVRVDENGNPVSAPQNALQTAFSENGITYPANAENAPVNGTEAGRSVIAPVRVGRDTTIKSPYQGATPVNFNSVSKSKPVITKEQVQQARQIVDAANTQHETSFKRYLKDAYQKVIGNRFNGTKVRVKGVTFQDAPYDVTLHKNVIGKVVSDPNFSVEKISVLNQLENVVGNAEYVGSGNFDKTGKRTNNVERYDYFETVVSLPSETGTTDYVVSFDTEIYPYENKFRTYKIKNIDLTPLSEVLAGTAPVANGNNAGLSTPIIPNSSQNSNRVFAPGITGIRENGKTISWSETQKDSVSNPAGAFEEKWGIKTAVVKPDGKTSASAFLKDGTVYLNADKVNTFYGALSKIAHEATHAVENTPAWNEIKKAAAAYYRAVDPNLRPSVMREAVRERYKGVAELTGDQAAAEVVAGFMEDICAQDSMVGERASRVLLEKSPNGFKRVVQFLRDKVESLKAYMPVGTGLSRQQRYELQAAQRGLRHLERALKTYRKGKAEAVQGTKYSIAKDQNGQNLVVVDTDQQLFEGKPKSEYAKIARRIINQRFKGKTLPLSENDLARVTQKSAGEYAYPSTKISSSNYNAKMRASAELDNLLKTSEFLYHANDTKNHPEATLGWDYYKTRFAIDGHFFEGQINIATSENGRVFYDITNIKELPNSGMPVTGMAQSAPTLVGEYSNTTIAPNAEGVNNSISKTSKNDPPYSYGGKNAGGNLYAEQEAQEERRGAGEEATASQAFKNWFGDWQEHPEKASKVVDRSGAPLVVYHGTPSGEFTAFDSGKRPGGKRSGTLGDGFYFAADKSMAQQYTGKDGAGRIIPVYLSIKKPYYTLSRWFNSEMISRMARDVAKQNGGKLDPAKGYPADQTQVQAFLKAYGYDGIIRTDYDGEVNTAVAFEPNQIKSADENMGSFDPDNPDIRYSYGEGSFTDYYLDYANRRYGTIPKGERVYREVSVPRQTGEGTKTRRAVRTILEAESTPDAAAEAVKKDLAKEAYAYTPEGDKAALDRAEKTIQTRGFQGALDRWNAAVNGAEPVGKEMMALGETLMAEAGKSGDIELFQKLAAEIAAEATNAGQAVQAVKLIKRFTPEGQLYYVRKAIDGLQKKLDRRMKGKAPELELDPELAKKLLEAKTAEEMETASMDILKSVAEQTPSTWQDKWDAWRYFAMLANPRTHIRNILGNTVFVPARMMKNGAVMLAERMVSPEERTQALLTKADQPLREFAEQNFETVKDSLTSTGKMNPSNIINELRPVYTSKAFAWLEKLRKLNNRALEAEDLFFLKRAYVSSMAKAMKARGLDADFLQSGSREATSQLRALEKLAAREALEATYRDASSTASALNRFKETNKATDIIGNALFPFTKTPVNVLKRGVEYSPAGLIKGVVDMTYGLKTGKNTAAEAVGSLCKGVSGLGIAALGYWLSSMGLLVAGAPEDDRERSFETLQGAKTYALKLGDVYYTIDWMAPVALPLFVGAEMQKAAEGEGFSAANIIDSLTKISEPMFNLSMLDGLNSTFKSISYGSAAPLADFAVNAAKDYITQALPTLGGQIARTIDPTARNSYYVDKNSPIPESVQEFLNAAQAKIPFLSFFLSPKVDQWGRTSGKDNALIRAFENFISPGYISTRNETAVDKEIAKIYKETGETGILPRTADKYFKADGETKRLSAQEYTKYAQERGKRSFEYINQLLSNPGYQKLGPDEKAEVIQQMYQAANAEAKKEAEPDYDIPNTVIKAYEANKQAGILYGDYYLYKMGLESTPNQQEVIDALNSIGSLSKSQKRFLFEQRFPNAKRKPFG